MLVVLLASHRTHARAEAPDPAGAEAADPRLRDETLIGSDQPKKRKRRGQGPVIGGYLQVFYKKRFDTDDTPGVEPSLFRIHRVRISVSGKVMRKVHYQVEVDPRAPEITGVLRDAYLELRHLPYHKIRIGQQKTPWGYENGESSSHLYTVTRTELAEGLGRGLTLRDIGIAVKGRIPLGGDWAIEDHVALVNGAGMNVQTDDTHTKDVWGRLGVRYLLPAQATTLRLGVSFGIGDYMEPEDPGPPIVPAYKLSFERVGLDLQVDTPWAFGVAEIGHSTDTTSTMPDEPEASFAWYVLLAGKTPWAIGPVLRYDVSDAGGFARWTLGAYAGDIDAALRAMVTYEIFEDDAGPHDHRLLMWTQVRI